MIWKAGGLGRRERIKRKRRGNKRDRTDARLTEENPYPDPEMLEVQEEVDLDEADIGSRRVENKKKLEEDSDNTNKKK